MKEEQYPSCNAEKVPKRAQSGTAFYSQSLLGSQDIFVCLCQPP